MNSELPNGSKPAWATAFTLMELLIVIAVITLLASLLLPALSGTKRVTQTAACKSRLRQIGMGLSLYTADFGVYPNSIEKLDRYLIQRPIGNGTTAAPMPLRTGRSPLLQCPTRLSYLLNLYGSLSWPQNVANSETNDSLGLALSSPTDTVYGPYLPDNSIAAPGEMFASGDTLIGGAVSAWPDSLFVRGIHFRPQYTHRPNRDYPDIGVANMLFCDGHVEDGRKAVWEARTEGAHRRWNRDHRPHNENFVE